MQTFSRFIAAASVAVAGVAASACAHRDAPAAAGRNAAGVGAETRAAAVSHATPAPVPPLAQRDDAAGSPRGALLYETHCSACHTAQVHWRERSLVSDWQSLTHQVWRWQSNANLDWSAADIDAVARYLNRVYYKLPAPVGPPARG